MIIARALQRVLGASTELDRDAARGEAQLPADAVRAQPELHPCLVAKKARHRAAIPAWRGGHHPFGIVAREVLQSTQVEHLPARRQAGKSEAAEFQAADGEGMLLAAEAQPSAADRRSYCEDADAD